MKMKEFGPGGAIPGAPLRSANGKWSHGLLSDPEQVTYVFIFEVLLFLHHVDL